MVDFVALLQELGTLHCIKRKAHLDQESGSMEAGPASKLICMYKIRNCVT